MRSRILAWLSALAVLTLLAAPSAPAARADSGLPSPVLAAAGWTVAQLTDGTHASGSFGPDHGLTADVILGLAATGAADATSRAGAAWLADHAQAYIDGGYAGDVSAGAVAKLALVARAAGADRASFGGLDLDRILRGRLQPSGRFTDSLSDTGPQPLDLSNVFTQAMAVLALRAGTDAPAIAVDFLARQRCADGGFPVFYPQRPRDCLSDADGTAVAVQALLAVGRDADAAPALAWLVEHQAPDGSLRNGGPGAVPNSNSTALAAQALRAAGRTAQADAAVSWLVSRQVGCSGPVTDRGAVGYSEAIADPSALRATAQALPALAGVSLAESDNLIGSGPNRVPVALCTATTSPTTTAATTTAPVTTPTPEAAAPAQGATVAGAAAAAPSPTPSGRSTPARAPIPIPEATGQQTRAPDASDTVSAEAVGLAEDPPPAAGSEPSAVAAASTPEGGRGSPGIPWWVGAAAVIVAAASWLAATGRLTGRSVAR